jgi:hypothetical protein
MQLRRCFESLCSPGFAAGGGGLCGALGCGRAAIQGVVDAHGNAVLRYIVSGTVTLSEPLQIALQKAE